MPTLTLALPVLFLLPGSPSPSLFHSERDAGSGGHGHGSMGPLVMVRPLSSVVSGGLPLVPNS